MWPFDYFRRRREKLLNGMATEMVTKINSNIASKMHEMSIFLKKVESRLGEYPVDSLFHLVDAHERIKKDMRIRDSEYTLFIEQRQFIINHINNLEKKRGRDGIVDELRGSVGDAFPGWSREDVESFSGLYSASDEDLIKEVESEREERRRKDEVIPDG